MLAPRLGLLLDILQLKAERKRASAAMVPRPPRFSPACRLKPTAPHFVFNGDGRIRSQCITHKYVHIWTNMSGLYVSVTALSPTPRLQAGAITGSLKTLPCSHTSLWTAGTPAASCVMQPVPWCKGSWCALCSTCSFVQLTGQGMHACTFALSGFTVWFS